MAMIQENRKLSGIFFRLKNEESGEMEVRCFEDFSEDQQKFIMEQNSKTNKDYQMWLEGLCLQLSRTIKEIGNELDLFSEYNLES